jgi:hypothetical protein
MKSKAKLLLMAIVVVLLVVIGLSGFLLFKGIRQFASAEVKLKRSVSMLRNYYVRNPFPSTANVDKEVENVRVVEEWYGKLLGALKGGEIAPQQKTPSTFMTLLSNTKNALVAQARPNQPSGTALPKDFAFGFDRYMAIGSLPAPADVPRLTQQLMITEQICRILFEERARGLLAIRRDEFEDVAAPPQEGAAPSARPLTRLPVTPEAAGEGVGQPKPDEVKQAGILKEGALYARMHFSVSFKATEKELLGILNRLSRHDMFAVVSSLRMDKAENDVAAVKSAPAGPAADVESPRATSPSAEKTSARARRSPGRAAAAPAPEVASGSEPAPAEEKAKATGTRLERLVCGPAMEKPMTVKMELDVYRFAGNAPASGG